MLYKLKRRLYFVAATYFGWWASVVLKRWQPRVIVITGSTGKTTALHLVEAQLGDGVEYSHHANSALGIPFHILGMVPNVEKKWHWFLYFIIAPFHALRRLPKAKLYIVEADCDRPNEGAFLSKLLRPEVTLWVSVFRTHSMNFDSLVPLVFQTHEEAISYEFGNFVSKTNKLIIANGDIKELTGQLGRAPKSAIVKVVSQSDLTDFVLRDETTEYIFGDRHIYLPGLHPEELAINLLLVDALLEYLNVQLDLNYTRLRMPPGRSAVFTGKKGTILIDSTYNTGYNAMAAILALFKRYPRKEKWVVIGDILEQGSLEPAEHRRLAEAILACKPSRIVLLGSRTHKYTLPILVDKLSNSNIPTDSFESPKEVLDLLQRNITGKEAILFKGGRFLEGVIEQLLDNPNDAKQLVRRGKTWVKRRQKWGLPR